MSEMQAPFSVSPTSAPGGSKLVIIAVALALVAVVLVNLYIESVKRQNQLDTIARYQMTVTKRPGERFDKDRDVREVRIPATFEEAFSTFVSGPDLALRHGQIVRRTVHAGAFLSYDVFTDVEGSVLDTEIAPNRRLYALPVNSRTIVGGLRPGMYVDIEAPFRGSGVVPVVLPVMERVRVITVGTRSIADEATGEGRRAGGAFQTVGIEVLPAATDKLSMIQRMAVGDFELILRNPSDVRLVKVPDPDPETLINPVVLNMLSGAPAPTASLHRGAPAPSN